MSTTISMWLGIAFLVLCITAVLLQAWLWGPKFWDEEAKKTQAPKFWLRMHALAGYGYGLIYVVMMWNMLPRLWEYQYELPARTVFHAVIGITIGVLLITKILILVFFRHFEESMPYFGFGLLLCTVVLSVLSIPYAVQAADLGGRTSDPANIERVRKQLAHVNFAEYEVDIDELTSAQGFERGRNVLVKKCTVCHDMRTILARPRTPQKWFNVSERMLDKPSVFGDQLGVEDIAPVTAYLAAITPELQRSTKKKRARARAAAKQADALIDIVHSGEDSAEKIDPSVGDKLLDQHCTGCHELDEVVAHGGDDFAGWRSVVAAMVEEGAEYGEQDAMTMSAYLAQKYPPTKDTAPPMPPPPADEGSSGEAVADSEGDTEGVPIAVNDASAGTGGTAVEPASDQAPIKRKRPKKKKKAKPKANATNGRTLFLKQCKTCHGSSGKGDTAFGRKLKVSSLSGLSRNKIRKAIANGVPGTKMRAYKSRLTKQEIEDITAFVRRL